MEVVHPDRAKNCHTEGAELIREWTTSLEEKNKRSSFLRFLQQYCVPHELKTS